jgi:hypothetical protein
MRYGAALAGWLAPSGHLIVSGFQADEEEPLRSDHGHRLSAAQRVEDEGWIGRMFTTSPIRSTAP